MIKVSFLFHFMVDSSRNRAQHSVAQENSEERSDQRRRHFMANLLRRSAQSPHRDHHAQNRSNNAQPGERIGDTRQCCDGMVGLRLMNFHVALHHLIEVKRRCAAHHRYTQGVANEIADVGVGFLVRRELLEDLALVGSLNVFIQTCQAIFASFLHNQIQAA